MKTSPPSLQSRHPEEATPAGPTTKKARFSNNSPEADAAAGMVLMKENQNFAVPTVISASHTDSTGVHHEENDVTNEATLDPKRCVSGQLDDPCLEPLPLFTPKTTVTGTTQESNALSNLSFQTNGSMISSDLTVGLLLGEPLFPSPEVSVTTITTDSSSFKGFSSDERRSDSEAERSGSMESRKSPPETVQQQQQVAQVDIRHAGAAPNVVSVNIGIQFQSNNPPSSRVLQQISSSKVSGNGEPEKQPPAASSSFNTTQKTVPSSKDTAAASFSTTKKTAPDEDTASSSFDTTKKTASTSKGTEGKKKKSSDKKPATAARSYARAGGCSCPRSRCLKLYCVCFSKGKFCDPKICQCKKCQNTQAHAGPKGIRTKSMAGIKARRADAFEDRPRRKVGQGCACKNNRCLKKYCVCFESGTKCSLEKCSCKNCQNPDLALLQELFKQRDDTPTEMLPQEIGSFSDFLDLDEKDVPPND